MTVNRKDEPPADVDPRSSSNGNDALLPSDGVYDLLESRRRRYVLYCLHVYANPMTLPTIADQVVEWEYDRPAEEHLDERLNVYLSLYHTHVPILEDRGVVTYSQAEDMVDLTDDASALRPHLERAAKRDFDTNEILFVTSQHDE